MARPTDTRERILASARALFVERGAQQTSLRDIADRLGITKPALYYHFDSREALLASIVEPLLADLDAFIVAREQAGPADARVLFGDYFDLLQRHRELLGVLVRDLATFGVNDLPSRMIEWRRRLMALLLGPNPALAAQVRAVVAVGGMSDTVLEFPGVPMEKIKSFAVDAACVALAGSPAPVKPARPAAAARPRRRKASR